MMHLLSKEGLALALEVEALDIGKANLKHLFGGVDKFLEDHSKI